MPDANPHSLLLSADAAALRLGMLRRLEILETAAEPAFDALVRAASAACRCPIALLTLVDADRVWCQAAVGTVASETPRDQSFCGHAIRGDALFLIPDTTRDARFAADPLVTGDLQVRFYAGQPIVCDGVAIGTLCVMHRVPRDLDGDQRAVLRHLTTVIGILLEERLERLLHRREAVAESQARDRALADAHAALEATQRRLVALTHNLPALVSYVDRDLRYTFVSSHYRRVFGEAADGFVGRTMAEVRPSVYEQLEPHIARALAGHCVEFEGSAPNADRLKHFQSSFVPDKDANGEVVGFYSMTFDLTARREAELSLIRSEKLLIDITNNIPAVIGEFDLEGRCLFANDLALRTHGLTRADMPALTFRSPLSDAQYVQMAQAHQDVLTGRSNVVQGMREVGDKPSWFESHFVPSVDDSGVQRGFYVTTFDITTLKQAEIERAISERRLRQLTDNLPVMISTLDADERTTYANERLRAWIGKKLDDIVGHTIEEVLGPALYAQRRDHLKRCLAGEQVSFEVESVVQGETRYFQTIYLPNPGVDGRIAGVTTARFDVTDRKRAERRLSHLAHSDGLTELPNRLHFDDEIARILTSPFDAEAPTAIMFLDVDRFKAVNDTYGHAVGDAVLKEFGRRIRRGVRPTDFVARLAGDEFVVVLEQVRPDEMPRIAAQIVDEVGRPFFVEQRQLVVTTSIGIAFRDRETTTAAALLARADVALYRAKEEGRNTFRLAA